MTKFIWVVTSRDGALLGSGRKGNEEDAYVAGVEHFRATGRKLGAIGIKDEHGTWRRSVDVKRDTAGNIIKR